MTNTLDACTETSDPQPLIYSNNPTFWAQSGSVSEGSVANVIFLPTGLAKFGSIGSDGSSSGDTAVIAVIVGSDSPPVAIILGGVVVGGGGGLRYIN